MIKKILFWYVKFIEKIVNFITFNISIWVALLLVLVMLYDVFLRYIFNSPTIWGYDTECMLGLTIYALGWSYVQIKDSHVRIDIFYDKMSARGKAIIDALGDILIGIPVCASYCFITFDYAKRAYQSGEVLQSSFWYPPAAPIRFIFFIGMTLFLLTLIRRLIQALYLIFKGENI